MATQKKIKFAKNVEPILVFILLFTSMLVGATFPIANGDPTEPLDDPVIELTVETDQPSYFPGNNVTFFGYLTEDGIGIFFGGVCPEIRDPNDEIIFTGICLLANFEGYYEYTIQLEPDAPLGTYHLEVHYSDDNNITASTTFEVISASLEVDAHGPYEGFVDDDIQFSGDVSGGEAPYTWLWEFDDGTNSTEQNPIHSFSTTGVHNAILTVTDSQNISGNDTATIFVYGEDFGYYLIVLTDETQYLPGKTVEISGRLTDNGTGVPSTQILLEIRDSEGGVSSNSTETNETGYYVSSYFVDYEAPTGLYNVTANVTIGDLDISTYALFEVIPHIVEVDANGPYEGKTGRAIEFFGDATGGIPPYSWHWDFGDGNTSIEQNPTHVYNTTGSFTVTLTVTDNYDNGGNDTTTATITEPPEITHTVLAEYGSFTTCQSCPTASKQLYAMYTSQNYDFYYVTLVIDESPRAEQRASEFGITLTPDVYFDGGYERVYGKQPSTKSYRDAITDCKDRTVPDLDINVSVVWKGNAVLEVNITLFYNESGEYNGVLRTYIVEPVSRWNGYDGEAAHFGLLDYSVEEVSFNATMYVNKTWSGYTAGYGDVTEDNIMVIAALFDNDTDYVDEVASGKPGELFSVRITKPTAGLYIRNNQVLPLFRTWVFGDIDVEVEAFNEESDIEKVKFYLNDELQYTDYSEPYSWAWDHSLPFHYRYRIKAVAYDEEGKQSGDEIIVWKFF